MRYVRREFHDGAGRYGNLIAGDAHGGGALEDVDRLFFPGMVVHDGRLPGLVAGDLRPELLGLEEHLADALVGREGLEGVEVEHLSDARRHGNRGLVHRRPPVGPRIVGDSVPRTRVWRP